MQTDMFLNMARQRGYGRHHPCPLSEHPQMPRSWPPTAWRTSTKSLSTRCRRRRHHGGRAGTSAAAPPASMPRWPSRPAGISVRHRQELCPHLLPQRHQHRPAHHGVPGGRWTASMQGIEVTRWILTPGVITNETTGKVFQAAAVSALYPRRSSPIGRPDEVADEEVKVLRGTTSPSSSLALDATSPSRGGFGIPQRFPVNINQFHRKRNLFAKGSPTRKDSPGRGRWHASAERGTAVERMRD